MGCGENKEKKKKTENIYSSYLFVLIIAFFFLSFSNETQAEYCLLEQFSNSLTHQLNAHNRDNEGRNFIWTHIYSDLLHIQERNLSD